MREKSEVNRESERGAPENRLKGGRQREGRKTSGMPCQESNAKSVFQRRNIQSLKAAEILSSVRQKCVH